VSRILVVEDEAGMRTLLRIVLEKDGHQVFTAADGAAGLAVVAQESLDLVIADIRMPGLDGVGLLTAIRERGLDLPVIMVTAYASSESAIQAMKHGAFDYLTKPFKMDEIKLVIQRALETRQPSGEPRTRTPDDEPALRGIIGRSAKMVELYKLISRIAIVDSTVLVTGESGTGKELVARTIHYNSPRGAKPFVAINCGALPEELLESELFGHVKGSFTGAIAHKAGLLEVASGGTVFLDEVAETSPRLQVKLLRFLQDRVFRRVGGTEDLEVDVRIMAATNRNLEQMVQVGAFREDLFYRLNVILLDIPPLRERRDDIPLLASSILEVFAARAGRPSMRIGPAAMAVLMAHGWPGNVRELENVLERAVALAVDDEIRPETLPASVRQPAAPPALTAPELPAGASLDQIVADLEQRLLRQALERTGWNQTKAAHLLGINFRSFRYRARKYGLDREIRQRNDGGT
jgi:two-component system, NtrC family, response regulator PilR